MFPRLRSLALTFFRRRYRSERDPSTHPGPACLRSEDLSYICALRRSSPAHHEFRLTKFRNCKPEKVCGHSLDFKHEQSDYARTRRERLMMVTWSPGGETAEAGSGVSRLGYLVAT